MPKLDELLEHFDTEEERRIKFSRRLRQAYEQIDARNRAVAMMKDAHG